MVTVLKKFAFGIVLLAAGISVALGADSLSKGMKSTPEVVRIAGILIAGVGALTCVLSIPQLGTPIRKLFQKLTANKAKEPAMSAHLSQGDPNSTSPNPMTPTSSVEGSHGGTANTTMPTDSVKPVMRTRVRFKAPNFSMRDLPNELILKMVSWAVIVGVVAAALFSPIAGITVGLLTLVAQAWKHYMYSGNILYPDEWHEYVVLILEAMLRVVFLLLVLLIATRTWGIPLTALGAFAVLYLAREEVLLWLHEPQLYDLWAEYSIDEETMLEPVVQTPPAMNTLITTFTVPPGSVASPDPKPGSASNFGTWGNPAAQQPFVTDQFDRDENPIPVKPAASAPVAAPSVTSLVVPSKKKPIPDGVSAELQQLKVIGPMQAQALWEAGIVSLRDLGDSKNKSVIIKALVLMNLLHSSHVDSLMEDARQLLKQLNLPGYPPRQATYPAINIEDKPVGDPSSLPGYPVPPATYRVTADIDDDGALERPPTGDEVHNPIKGHRSERLEVVPPVPHELAAYVGTDPALLEVLAELGIISQASLSSAHGTELYKKLFAAFSAGKLKEAISKVVVYEWIEKAQLGLEEATE